VRHMLNIFKFKTRTRLHDATSPITVIRKVTAVTISNLISGFSFIRILPDVIRGYKIIKTYTAALDELGAW
jgi:hypothetical protein